MLPVAAGTTIWMSLTRDEEEEEERPPGGLLCRGDKKWIEVRRGRKKESFDRRVLENKLQEKEEEEKC